MEQKRYYWLKLQDDFFSSKRIKKLRKIAGGDTYTIIYLKMQLLSIKNGGVLKYSGLESTFAEELALDLDEDVENVSITLQYLLSCGLVETSDNIEYLIPFAAMNTGSEGSGAKRVRDFRNRQKALHCNAGVTQVKRLCNGEKEIELEIEKEIEKDIGFKKKETCKEKKFIPPTLDDVREYAHARESSVDPDRFYEYFNVGNWKDSEGKPVMNWKQKFITWEKKNVNGGKQRTEPYTFADMYLEMKNEKN